MKLAGKMLIITIAGMLFVLAHEGGHYMAAASFGLNPSITFSDAGNGLSGFSIGVTHAPASMIQDYLIIMAAFIIPLFCALYFGMLYSLSGSEALWLLSAVFVVLIIATLLPFPGMQEMDSNRIFSALLAV
ncbi:MAG: hypothetical protein QXU82_02665 [Candidatus Aenigmatarchaeota archaeon]